MKAKYNATGNYLEELPAMEKPPSPWKYESGSVKELVTREWKLYNEHIMSLRRIHCHPSCVGKWSDGQELTEGVEYEVKKHCIHADNCLLSSACITCDDTAFPLPVKSEDEIETLKAENEKMRKALEVIANWQLPPTGKVWDNDNAQPISFEAEYGSNGARDYMKSIATEALK